MLKDADKYYSECVAADSDHLRKAMRESMIITTTVMRKNQITLDGFTSRKNSRGT